MKKSKKAGASLTATLKKQLKYKKAQPKAKKSKDLLENLEAKALLARIRPESVPPSKNEDDGVEVEVCDTQTPLVGIPRPAPAIHGKKPHGNYYETKPGDLVYAPVLPSSNPNARVTAAPDIQKVYKKGKSEIDWDAEVEKMRAEQEKVPFVPTAQALRTAQIQRCIDEIKVLAHGYLADTATEEVATLNAWLAHLKQLAQ